MPDSRHPLVRPLQAAGRRLAATPVPEADLVDVIGDTEVVIRALRDVVAAWKSELPDKIATARYREVGGRSAARSYNTQKILGRVAGQLATGGDVLGALRHAIERDAVRLTWRWTELKALYEALDLTMTIAPHEIADGDLDADVGEVWTTATKVEAVPDAG